MKTITIDGHEIGPGRETYIIAELSGNHHQDLDLAKEMIRAAKLAGADAVKLQTYRPDTLTIDSHQPWFEIKGSTPWDGQTLYDVYASACTPWDWYGELKELAAKVEITLFSTPFDTTAVDFLENYNPPAYKIASFELVHLPLIYYVARSKRPLLMSTGMASAEEIHEAVRTARRAGTDQIALLHCNSSYPADPRGMDLRTIPHMTEMWNMPVGLSDHTLSTTSAIAAVTLGANIVEKHFVLSRSIPGPDSAFSLEPAEFRALVNAIREVEKGLGHVRYGPSEAERKSMNFRRSLFVVADVRRGELFTPDNVRIIRPGYGLAPRYLDRVLGRVATEDIAAGTPLQWEFVGGPANNSFQASD